MIKYYLILLITSILSIFITLSIYKYCFERFRNTEIRSIDNDLAILDLLRFNDEDQQQIWTLKKQIIELQDVTIVLSDRIKKLDTERQKDFDAVFEYIKTVTIKIIDINNYVLFTQNILQSHDITLRNIDNKLTYLESKIKELENESRRCTQDSTGITTETKRYPACSIHRMVRQRHRSCR